MKYSIEGDAGSRVVTWMWNTASQDGPYDYSGNGAQRYSYNIVYREDTPNIWTFNYNTVSDKGSSATVGAQGYSTIPDGSDGV